tara:strand:- start:406 stop:582 length:177 start_codon:yes stop_codon:yes gene_type:complete
MIQKMHPATIILWFLLIISMLTNYAQILQVQRLEKEIAPIIIKPNIRLSEPPPDERIT